MKFNKVLAVGFEKSELGAASLKKIDGLSRSTLFYPEKGPKLLDNLTTTDCLLVKFNPVTRKMIDSLPNLKYIGVMSTSYARVDFVYARKKDITVTNVPGYSTESVAEFVFGVILERIRDLERGKQLAKQGNYSEDGFRASEIKGKTFGILGLGRIGSRVALLAQSFGANVIYWSKHRKRELEAKGVKYKDVQFVLSESDFISIHFSLTKETQQFLNKTRIANLKKGALVVNTAPMEIVDISALEKRLKTGDITFILDHSDEMNAQDLKNLSRFENCSIYPPIAYISTEAKSAKREILVKNIDNFLKGSPSNVVN